MKVGETSLLNQSLNKFSHGILSICMLMALNACNPHNVQVEMPITAPVVKVTNYSQTLSDLGLMTEIFAAGELKVQSDDIADNTGTSATSGGEIQRNITEIMKSTLNSIGGTVTFIEYNPSYIQNQMVTGYSQFDDKTIPDVVITGGITEFDRALETRGEGTDMAAEAEVSGLPTGVPSPKIGFEFSDSSKSGKARITLDFNMKDFRTLAGIPKMNTVNSMEVHKAVREKEIGVVLFGPTFGSKGSIKKVQGRHEAVRMLVEVSMIQMVGKYLVLPYWKLLGDDNEPDRVVTDKLARSYARMSEPDRIANVQEWLYLHGYDVNVNGVLDQKTNAAIAQFNPSRSGTQTVDRETFTSLYLTIPINQDTLSRRYKLNQMASSGGQVPPPASPTPVPSEPKPTEQASAEVNIATPAPTRVEASPPAPARTPSISPAPASNSGAGSSRSIGRILTDDQW